MIRYFCQCGTELFFENSACSVCGSELGFDPQSQRLLTLSPLQLDRWYTTENNENFRVCELRDSLGCNWLIAKEDNNKQCLSCRTTRTIPTLSLAKNNQRWQRLEQTKRRALYMILRLVLPMTEWQSPTHAASQLPDLIFDFLEDQRSNSNVAMEFVYSGHSNGVITINAAEADDSFRASHRELMNEQYRTLLGHFRHELGHYYWLLFNPEHNAELQQQFGDDGLAYQEALENYYRDGAQPNWQDNYISAYASAHPLEDWAETWAHYLHISDTLETAIAYGMFNEAEVAQTFEQALLHWGELTVMLNSLNRSMGVDDAYPFIISPTVRAKLCFINRLVSAWRATYRSAATTERHGAKHHAKSA